MTTQNKTSRPVGAGGPEWLFGVGMSSGPGGRLHGKMISGEWMRGPDGTPAVGALGVLIDDTLGVAAAARRPESGWPVTTELSIDYVTPPPCDGQAITSEGGLLAVDSLGALGTGTVQDESGRTLALMTLRSRYVPGVPERFRGAAPTPRPADEPTEETGPERKSLLSLLDASFESDDRRVRLRLPGDPVLGNATGALHGGIALCASQLAASRWFPAEEGLSIASTRITYLRRLDLSGPVEFTARPVHHGRTFRIVEVTSSTPSGKPATIATVSGYAGERPAS